MRWQFNNVMAYSSGYRENMKLWAQYTYLIELRGKYVPRRGGWM